MKKMRFFLMTVFAFTTLITGCKKNEINEQTDQNSVGQFSHSELVEAFSRMYSAWEESTTLPETLKVGSVDLTKPQYQFALCKLLLNINDGDKSDINVLNYKPADHPDRDSYDKETIAVSKGPQNGDNTEDLLNIAKRIISAMEAKGKVPNQTIFAREGSAIAFSTNRATVTIARVIADYKANSKLATEVSTDYLSASATLKGFAQKLITYLEVWQRTVGNVDADGSHCTANNSAWENVHFIPIPESGGYSGTPMYSEQYKPYHEIEVNGVKYNAAQCFVIAAKGILDLITKEGSIVEQQERNTPVHTLADGKALNSPIPSAPDWAIWGGYPWYEKADDGGPINFNEANPCNLEFIVRSIPWFLTRAAALGHIGNFISYSTKDPDTNLISERWQGLISPMRMLLISARFYKKILDENITENVYTALKDATFDPDLYGIEMPDVELKTKEVVLGAKGNAVEAEFTAKKNWTATPAAAWIKVEPGQGEAGNPVSIQISAEANTGAARESKVSISCGNVKGIDIVVKQEGYIAPSSGTLKDFAKEFVKGLDIWSSTVGTVSADGTHCSENGNAWENVHFIPIPYSGGYTDGADQYDKKYTPWILNVKGREYTAAQAWEIAIRGMLNLITAEGESMLPLMDDRNKAFTFADGVDFNSAEIPEPSSGCKWGKYPWYENNSTVKYNGSEISEVGLDFIVKVTAWHVVRGLVKTEGNKNPLGAIGNFQEFGTTSSTLNLSGYEGLICPMRELLIVARFYKDLLDKNVDSKIYTYAKDKKYNFDLYNQGAAPVSSNTIKAFASEYVKIIDIWNSTTGKLNSYTGEDLTSSEHETYKEFDFEGGHYVPLATTISVNGKNYTTADMLEVAERAFLLLRGVDGNNTSGGWPSGGASTFPKLPESTMESPIPETHNYVWGKFPSNETDGNGGHLKMGKKSDPVNAKSCKVKIDILDNFAQRHVNYGITRNGAISNLCGYPREGWDGEYFGAFSATRALITYAFFFKYMLDNNLKDATEISADQTFRSELFGNEN